MAGPKGWLMYGSKGALAVVAVVALLSSMPLPAQGADSSVSVLPDSLASAPTDEARAYRQMEPDSQISEHFSEASEIKLSIGLVPDPRVPRHRRRYDLTIVAIIQGMTDAGYTLDRYVLPWREPVQGSGGDDSLPIDDCNFGVLVFRRDRWREPKDVSKMEEGPSIHAVYVVPENSAAGVPRMTMLVAMDTIWSQIKSGKKLTKYSIAGDCSLAQKDEKSSGIPDNANVDKSIDSEQEQKDSGGSEQEQNVSDGSGQDGNGDAVNAKAGQVKSQGEPSVSIASHQVKSQGEPSASLASHLACPTNSVSSNNFVVFGPNFSGSLASLAQVNLNAAENGMWPICAVSASATTSSNYDFYRFPHPVGRELKYSSLAVSDEVKMASLWDVARRIGVKEGEVVLLGEASVFGRQICPATPARPPDCSGNVEKSEDKAKCLCSFAVQMSFPANLADLRQGMNARVAQANEESSLRPFFQSVLPSPLNDDVGNDSEFPYSRQSPLTVSSNDIELRQALIMVQSQNPKMIIVAATDVRDRLFLFNLLRNAVGQAQFVDLEVDVLVSHPSHMHGSRGALLVGSDHLVNPDGWGDEAKSTNTTSLSMVSARPYMLVASTDHQMILRNAIRDLHVGEGGSRRTTNEKSCEQNAESGPVLYVVGRDKMFPLACATPKEQWLRVWLAPALLFLALVLQLSANPSAVRIIKQEFPASPFAEKVRSVLSGLGYQAANLSSASLLMSTMLLLFSGYIAGSGAFALAFVCSPILFWALDYQASVIHAFEPGVPEVVTSWRGLLRRVRYHFFVVASFGMLLAMMFWWLAAAWTESGRVMLVRMAADPFGGMAVGFALMLAFFALQFAGNALTIARGYSARNCRVITEGIPLARDGLLLAGMARAFTCGIIPRTWPMVIGVFGLAGCFVMAVPVRATVFGSAASWLVLASVLSLSFVALTLFANAAVIRARIFRLSGELKAIAARGSFDSSSASFPKGGVGHVEAIGLWPPCDAQQVHFSRTPAVALVREAGVHASELLPPQPWRRFSERFSADNGFVANLRSSADSSRVRGALYVLLASEVALVRWATFSAATCSLAVVGVLYLFPVSGSTAFAVFSLGLLALVGLFAGHTAMAFERDEVLSNVLCNRTAKLEFSTSLFIYIAFPLVALAISLAVAQVPGVLDWGDGVLDAAKHLLPSGLLP